MRWRLLAVVSALFGCQPPPVPIPEEPDAGQPPSLQLSSSSFDLGRASLRFADRPRRTGAISIRSHDAVEAIVVEAVASAPGCVGTPCASRATFVVPPGASLEVPVGLDIGAVGRVMANVSFSAPGLVTVSTVLFGEGTAAPDCLVVEPSILDLGQLNRGCPVRSLPVRITNDCVIPRLLNGTTMVPATEPFSVSALTSLPRRLSPGESWAGIVEFLGGVDGRHEAQLLFFVDGQIAAGITLEGLRTSEGTREFTFTAPSPLIDVLVVLDSSPSFVPRRLGARQRVWSDVTDFNRFPGPLRVGVMGTGVVGLVRGGARTMFENGELDYETEVYAALTNVPVGDEVERCLETAAQVPASFWREGSRRRAVCITDAPDESVAPLSAIATLADAGVSWDVIGPPLVDPDGGCAVEAFDDGVHVFNANALGGSVTSICDNNWHLPIVPPAPPMPMLYRLSEAPIFPIAVFIDGAMIPPNEWNWEPTIRTLEVQRRPLNSLVIRESLFCMP